MYNCVLVFLLPIRQFVFQGYCSVSVCWTDGSLRVISFIKEAKPMRFGRTQISVIKLRQNEGHIGIGPWITLAFRKTLSLTIIHFMCLALYVLNATNTLIASYPWKYDFSPLVFCNWPWTLKCGICFSSQSLRIHSTTAKEPTGKNKKSLPSSLCFPDQLPVMATLCCLLRVLCWWCLSCCLFFCLMSSLCFMHVTRGMLSTGGFSRVALPLCGRFRPCH